MFPLLSGDSTFFRIANLYMLNPVNLLGHLLESLLDLAIKGRSVSNSGVDEEMFGRCDGGALSYSC